MELSELLYRVSLVSTKGNMSLDISTIQFDSRKVAKGDMFIALSGVEVDGHQFIDSAVEKGAVVIVCNALPEKLADGITYIQVKDSTEAIGIIAANLYGNPTDKITLVGVTGTNGKTTTATLLFQLFTDLGYNCGLISTVTNRIISEELPSTHTTPDILSLNQLLAEMVKKGVTHCFMEVSSHALQQKRNFGLKYKAGIFTNITHDHLDYHKTFDNYISAKKLLFDHLPKEAVAIVNIDDRRGKIMLQNCVAEKVTISLKAVADVKGRLISSNFQGLEMEIDGKEVWFQMVGSFNAYNLLGVYATATQLGEDSDAVLQSLSKIRGVTGRFESIRSSEGVIGIVDYAHTPDALENVLQTISSIRSGNEKVITVFGCGGNRDKTKRPVMTSVACQYSDTVIVTSDNPRNEDPATILRDMIEKLDPVEIKKVLKILDREDAIKTACMMAKKGDIILVAGKGHETYQEIKGERYPFDDREVLKGFWKINEI